MRQLYGYQTIWAAKLCGADVALASCQMFLSSRRQSARRGCFALYGYVRMSMNEGSLLCGILPIGNFSTMADIFFEGEGLAVSR